MQIKTDLWVMSNALFLDWKKLKTLIEFRLGALLGRRIHANPFRDADYWDVGTGPISSSEMKLLFEIADADEEDKANHSGEKLAMESITDAFALKLIAAELPFPVKTAVPTENGVYFIGRDIPYSRVYSSEENAYESE